MTKEGKWQGHRSQLIFFLHGHTRLVAAVATLRLLRRVAPISRRTHVVRRVRRDPSLGCGCGAKWRECGRAAACSGTVTATLVHRRSIRILRVSSRRHLSVADFGIGDLVSRVTVTI